jgi:hypothetical protein
MVSQVLTEDGNLTHQIDDIDKQVGLLQKQRKDLVGKKKDVKKRFTRQILRIASRTDGKRYRNYFPSLLLNTPTSAASPYSRHADVAYSPY